MPSTSPEQALLNQDHRRRRWAIRVSLILLLLVIILVVTTLILTSSSTLAPDEALAICATFHEKTTRTDMEHQLGKPNKETIQDGVVTLSWRFISQSFNEMDILDCKMSFKTDGTIDNQSSTRCQMTGWSAWIERWELFKYRLGIK